MDNIGQTREKNGLDDQLDLDGKADEIEEAPPTTDLLFGQLRIWIVLFIDERYTVERAALERWLIHLMNK